ncbi:carboxypeptidase M32 [Synechococcus sp. RSCCF101]|uniref:carboxypeptidase M32 n=1 Tax=Synechococcus sp. RSCCF101 TaxID=2511069 RepID=UPI001246C352|nr:carboxypeptidase M32 [Synechococcus sp. RSCCF101]QEY31400.1 carboxypeptidase M32 [Synechococcus sp. RSCCF101]
MSAESSAFSELRGHLHRTRLLRSISNTLSYDQQTAMPPAGSDWRGEQLALLAEQLHQRQSSEGYGDLLAAAESELAEQAGASPDLGRTLLLLRREYERQRAQDPALVVRIAEARVRGSSIWQEARRRNSFRLFAPALTTLIELRREQARQLASAEPGANGCWEILAQPFEPDVRAPRLEQLFTPLLDQLPALLERARSRAAETAAPALPADLQERLCRDLLRGWGYDPSRCSRALSAHPFSSTLGPADFRITTRIVPDQPMASLLATAHEWGHSLYEQGLPHSDEQDAPWPLGQATSMGVHESQALFWECRVARSEAFARRWHRPLVEGLGADPWESPGGLWRSLNPLHPGLIRVESGELGYCLHIVLRFELERALLEQDLPVEELPERWNRRSSELLGITPPSDAQGCLQDIHWAEGLFGYFPSYALGHLISAQLSEAMEAELGAGTEALIERGEDARILSWLRHHVHPLGRRVNGEQLVQQVSGRPLEATAFLRHLSGKLERLLSSDR